MYDLTNLNDYEFELLSKDIMKKKLGIELESFSRGKDGGIDICDVNSPHEIIIQAKHYPKSRFYDLKRAMNKEKEHIKEHKPQKYYLVTSLSLTKKNKEEIIEMFPSCMKTLSFVVGKENIDDFLENAENKDIVQKHYKLWLAASSVLQQINNQNVFIDCEALLADIENQSKLFVETSTYREALKILSEKKIVILTGGPGVGKSTLSKMLVLFFVSQDYSVRYTTNNNLSDIKNVLSRDREKKEIVLLDDFLGQCYLNMTENQPSEISSLISLIQRSISKFLILNSRITILNAARSQFLEFDGLMEQNKHSEITIDLDKMSLYEKAKILYNHMYCADIPSTYFVKIKENQNYFKIVRHKNYNPRIVEYVTKPSKFKDYKEEEYISFIFKKLDNPDDVWRDEFNNRLSSEDRILASTLYSLTDTMIDEKILKKAFNLRIRKIKDDTTLNFFQISLKRLTNSVFKTVHKKGKMKISTINPSVNDYLRTAINDNPNEQIAIIQNAVYIEQILRVSSCDESVDEVKKLLLSGDLLNMEVHYNSSFYYYIKLIVKYKIFKNSLKEYVRISFLNMYKELRYSERSDYGKLVVDCISKEFCDYYDLPSAIKNIPAFYPLLGPLDWEYLIAILRKLIVQGMLKGNEECIRSLLINKTLEKMSEYADEELLPTIIQQVVDIDEDDIDIYSGEVEAKLLSELESMCCDLIKENGRIYQAFSITNNDIDFHGLSCIFDIEDEIRNYMETNDYNFYENYGDETGDEEKKIREIFER